MWGSYSWQVIRATRLVCIRNFIFDGALLSKSGLFAPVIFAIRAIFASAWKKKRGKSSSFGFQSLTTRGTSGNAEEEEDDDVEAAREMVKTGGEEEEDEEVRLAGGPTAVNRDGSNGQTSRVPETPTYFRQDLFPVATR